MEENLENKSAFGTAGLVLGIIGVCTSFIPFINNLSFVLGILGVIFAVVCFTKKASKGKAIAALVLGILTMVFTISAQKSLSDSFNELDNGINNELSNISQGTSSDSQLLPAEKTYSFNEKFKFDDLEIKIGSNYSFDTVKNSFSEYNNKRVVKLPVTVKNLSTETHNLNMFFYSIFGSKGTEMDSLGAYFDNDVNFAGKLRSGASYTKYMYFLYDGNGKYTIEFDNYSEKITVELDIKR